MRIVEQTWSGAAASFLATWVVMMVALMLPSLVPMLWRSLPSCHRRGGRDIKKKSRSLL